MNVALVKNNTVDNIIVVNSLEWAQENLYGYEQIFDTSVTPVAIGWIFKDGVWQDPNTSSSSTPILKSVLTPLEFLNRFTDEESKTIIGLSKTNPDVELWWIKYNKAQDIDLDDPQTIEGVNMLEQATILAPGRAAEILTKYPL